MGTNRKGIRFIAGHAVFGSHSLPCVQSLTVPLGSKIEGVCKKITFLSPNLEIGIIVNLTTKKVHLPYESSFSYSGVKWVIMTLDSDDNIIWTLEKYLNMEHVRFVWFLSTVEKLLCAYWYFFSRECCVIWFEISMTDALFGTYNLCNYNVSFSYQWWLKVYMPLFSLIACDIF